MASHNQQNATTLELPQQKHRVLVVDDSAVARLVVKRMVDDIADFEIAGQAASAEAALEILQGVGADIILLDIEMPGMSGIDAIPHFRNHCANIPILIVSSHCDKSAESSVRAMAAGASDMLLKPTARAFAGEFAETLESRMRYLVEAARTRPDLLVTPVAKRLESTTPATFARPVACIALGSSTGGLHALTKFFEAFPADLRMPMLITQHLPPDFISYFARQMQQIAGRDVEPAIDGEVLAPGKVLVAPGDRHLTVRRYGETVRIVLQNSESESGSCPSVDPMLASVAQVFGEDAVGIVLSGMGKDGAQGAQVLADSGGEVLAQDSQSSVIWGMPGAVASAGIANLVEAPDRLARHVAQRARAFGWK